MNQKPLSVKELADYLSIHTDTLYKMVKEKKLPHFRIGGKILFTRSAINEWIAEQEKN